jgi:malate dehydrogenase (oxaloacetate-decarboxylating)(NADP+)
MICTLQNNARRAFAGSAQSKGMVCKMSSKEHTAAALDLASSPAAADEQVGTTASAATANPLVQAALEYHAKPRPGKISVEVTKSAASARELSLAYSPGVAEPVRCIAADPEAAYEYTAKGNLVGIISNGTAILGLGDLGPLASKPVMEGKALLFKRFAGIDCFDVEVDATDVPTFVDTVARIANTFGGINIEDVSAPSCFDIEEQLVERCSVPVFHDDQHGTAICVAAGLLNALELQRKQLRDVRVVCLGGGADGTACLKLLISMGLPAEQITVLDRQGCIHTGRSNLPPYKAQFARDMTHRTLDDALAGADVFLGVSGADLLSPALLASMAPRPIIFALSNPDPEIRPELAHRIRDDVIVATGRSDYPNQVNNVLGFPFIFRGALDVRATRINDAMKMAAVAAIAAIALLRGVRPGPMDTVEIMSPLALPIPRGLVDAAIPIVTGFAVVYFLVACVDLILRYRRSRAVERAQLKWFAASFVFLVAAFVLVLLVAEPWLAEALPPQLFGIITTLTFTLGLGGMATAIGIAVLRYRLFEIDRLVSRTVTYAVIVGLLVAVYAAAVVGLPRFLPGAGRSDVVVAASTLLVAALFSPLRRRVRVAVDRRFNRAGYDAAAASEAFAARLRDEVDPDALADALQTTVRSTLAPATTALWLAADGSRRAPEAEGSVAQAPDPHRAP